MEYAAPTGLGLFFGAVIYNDVAPMALWIAATCRRKSFSTKEKVGNTTAL
jgi:hypothetical protein